MWLSALARDYVMVSFKRKVVRTHRAIVEDEESKWFICTVDLIAPVESGRRVLHGYRRAQPFEVLIKSNNAWFYKTYSVLRDNDLPLRALRALSGTLFA
jgi:hypothetical protein